MTYSLKQLILEARSKKIAIGHFNFGTMAMAKGIFEAAQQLSSEHGSLYECGKIPVVLGISEGDRKLFGDEEALAIVKLWREKYDYPIFLNADHTHGVDDVCKLISYGYDMVIYDAASSSNEENIKNTKQVVAYRNEHNPSCLVEAELGFIGSGSVIKDTVPEGVSEATMTKPEDAIAFVSETGIDMLAPSVGNVHGLIRSGKPRLHPVRVEEIANAVPGVPLVLHGGSGSLDEDFTNVIKTGISMIHISTEIRKAYREATEAAFAGNPSVSPGDYVPAQMNAVKELVYNRLKLFSGIV